MAYQNKLGGRNRQGKERVIDNFYNSKVTTDEKFLKGEKLNLEGKMEARKISRLTVDILSACNLACEFCYNSSNSNGSSENERNEYLGASQLEHLAGIYDARVYEIGGGEPFLHPQLQEILMHISEKEKRANISTNATFIPEWFFSLPEDEKKKLSIQVSLHAASPKVYHEVTGKYSFDKVIENLQRLKESYAPLVSGDIISRRVCISSAIYSRNFDEVPGLIEIAEQNNVPLRVNLVFPVGRGKNVKLLSVDEVKKLQDLLLTENVRTRGLINSPLIHKNSCPVLEESYSLKKETDCLAECGQKLYIDVKGGMHACEFLVA